MGRSGAKPISTRYCRLLVKLRGLWQEFWQQVTGMSEKHLYKVVFMNQGQVFEVYARQVRHGELFGFVEVEQLVFGERTTVVVDPSEEKIKSEFENVRRTFLPMHSIIRIDEVDKQGVSKISKAQGGNVAQFPMPIYTPGDTKS